METHNVLIAIITAVIGSGGISAVISAFLSARKYRAEARQIEETSRRDLDQYVNEKLKEVTEMYISQTRELKDANSDLQKQITDLQHKLQGLMSWVIYDNQNYRMWLETELRRLNPNIEFPKCAPPPQVFSAGSPEQLQLERSIENLNDQTNSN